MDIETKDEQIKRLRSEIFSDSIECKIEIVDSIRGADEDKDKNYLAYLYQYLSIIESTHTNNESAVKAIKKSIRYLNSIEDERKDIRLGNSYNNLGLYYVNLFLFEYAIGAFDRANNHFGKVDYPVGEINVLVNKGVAYEYMSNYAKGYQYYSKALKRTIDSNIEVHPNMYTNVGNSLAILFKDRYNEAENYFIKAFNLFEEGKGDLSDKAVASQNYGSLLIRMGRFDEGEHYIKLAIDYANEIPDPIILIRSKIFYAEILAHKDGFDNVKKLLRSIEKSLEKDETIHLKLDASYKLYTLYKRFNQFEKALKHYEVYNYYKGKFVQEKKDAKIHTLRLENIVEKERSKSDLLEDKNQKLRYNVKKLHQLHNERNNLFNMITHDLKNPISAITGYAYLAKTKKYMTQEDHFKYYSTIEQSANEMLRVIENLIELSRLEKTTQSFNYEDLELDLVKRKIIKNFSFKAASKNIELNFSDRFDLSIYTDPEYFVRVMDNLTSNAIKFSYRDSTIYFDAWYDDGSTYITIRDEGQGMSHKDLSKVFQKYAKLSAKPTANESSSSLGLSIVKDICEKLDIDIVVDSEGKDKGTEFVLRV